MTIDLLSVLPLVLPRAIEWANARSSEILAGGKPLNESGLRLATAVGVLDATRIRVSTVSALPLPEDPDLRAMALETGLLGPNMIGLTLGYGIYICDGHEDHRLISHECRHVHQYEATGSIENFLPVYLQQIAVHGYHDAPFEVDAREHEINTI